MGLISKTVKIRWINATKKYYEKLGYIFTKIGDEFEVKVEDLPKGSSVKVKCICDNCKVLLNPTYRDYNKTVKSDGKTYCNKCSVKLFTAKKLKETKFELSFARWLINNFGKNALELYWDYEKNIDMNPWEIGYCSHIKVWIKCQEKDYHGSYEAQCYNFVKQKHNCPYCTHNKLHPLDSLGQDIINNYGEEFLWKIWSDKNKLSPFEVAPYSCKKYYFKCLEGEHEDSYRSPNNAQNNNFNCPFCINEKDNSKIEEKVKIYLQELGYIVKIEHECTIKLINPKTGRPLPFDNEIILENGKHLIIEVHGRQHYKLQSKSSKWLKEGQTPEEQLHKRKLYDRYKRIKCIQAGYEYLEIPYTAFDKKETYKLIIKEKVKEILNKI